MIKLAFAFMLVNAVFYALSFFAKSKVVLLLLQIVSNIFFGLQYLVLKAYTGAIVIAVDTVRILAFFFVEKFKNTNLTRTVVGLFFIIACIISAALTWDRWFSILPLLATTLAIVSLMTNNLLLIKIFGLISCPFQMIYMIFIKSYFNLIVEIFIIIMETIAVTIDIVKMKKQKRQSALQNLNPKNQT